MLINLKHHVRVPRPSNVLTFFKSCEIITSYYKITPQTSTHIKSRLVSLQEDSGHTSNLRSTKLTQPELSPPNDTSAFLLLAKRATYHSNLASKLFRHHEQRDKWMKRYQTLEMIQVCVPTHMQIEIRGKWI